MPDKIAMTMFDTPKRAMRPFTPILYFMSRWSETGNLLEIGTGTAFQSTRAILGGLADRGGGRLTSVDIRKREHRVPEEYMDMWNFIEGDSTDDGTIEQVRSLGLFDCVLIDGGHETDIVREDFRNYGELGKYVMLHDTRNSKPEGGVQKFFEEDIEHNLKCVEFGPFPGFCIIQMKK